MSDAASAAPPEAAIERLAALFAQSCSAVVLTGAGMSTDSGVPDFRSPGSPWALHPPMDFRTFLSGEPARVEAWRRKFAMDDLYAGAAPCRSHRALADLVRRGRIALVVTQNIDNMHQRAGVPDDRLVELHGNGSYARCLECGLRHELAPLRAEFEATGRAPACSACGGPVKSATIAFGQAMPEAELRRAVEATLACDLFVAIGSSLLVQPAARLPLAARGQGARVAILNREPTPLDRAAHLSLQAEIGAVLPALAEALA